LAAAAEFFPAAGFADAKCRTVFFAALRKMAALSVTLNSD